jgi:hypothetical protein
VGNDNRTMKGGQTKPSKDMTTGCRSCVRSRFGISTTTTFSSILFDPIGFRLRIFHANQLYNLHLRRSAQSPFQGCGTNSLIQRSRPHATKAATPSPCSDHVRKSEVRDLSQGSSLTWQNVITQQEEVDVCVVWWLGCRPNECHQQKSIRSATYLSLLRN